MAQPQPDISSLLAALAAQRNSTTPSQPPVAGTPSIPQYTTPGNTNAYSQFSLPQPTNSGSLDLSGVKPVNTGSVSIADALASAREFAAGKGIGYDADRGGDPRLSGRSYRRSRSRSRSPNRRDQYRDNYNPYRDERRGGGGRDYGRSRSRSPQRGSRSTFSPQRNVGRDRSDGHGDDNSEVILIDSALVGLVIGRAGENLRRVEQDTQTRIQFITGPESGSPQRQCRISGPVRARMEAKREINRIIAENGGNPVRELGAGGGAASPSSNNRDRGGASSRGQKDGSNHPALREGENSIQIMVPDRTVGLIIGRGGETIRDLQERSGCHINIVGENKSISGMRPVNLIGSHHAAQKAKDAIMEIVESDTRTGGSSGGGGMPAPKPSFDPYQQGGSSSDKATENIMVPSDAVGMIIGKGGETIKDMQNYTGCKINVTQPSQPDIEREIGLIGTRQAIEAAKRAIFEKVDSVRARDRAKAANSGGDFGGSGQGQYSQQQPSYSAPAPSYSVTPGQNPAAQPPGQDGADPYAAYGGVQGYYAAWYAAITQQQQQQGGQAPGQAPPGT